MTAQDILRLIQYDADSFNLRATDALSAFAEILADLEKYLSEDDFIAMIAIGSALHHAASR